MTDIIKGKIIKGVGGLYTVRPLCACAQDEIRCRARGSFRHKALTPLVGDNVIISYGKSADGQNTQYVIDDIEERKNSLIRPPMANLDFLFITMAAASPSPILSTIDKLICIAEYNKIEPIIVITKAELSEQKAKELYEIYSDSGFECFCLSAVKDIGIPPLEKFISERLPTKTAAFAGASGIGKSTLLNKLFPSLELETAQISKKIERGKHTTRAVTLFPLSNDTDCAYIADTPGFSMLDFKRFDFFEKDDLVDTMRDFAPFIGECKYSKCSHTKEEGCAVLDAVKNGKIKETRHQSYVELYEILKTRKTWD